MLSLGNAVQVFGVVEAGADSPHECLVTARVDAHLSLDLQDPKSPNYGGCCDVSNLWKYDMPAIMTFLNFIQHQHATHFDVYLRRAEIRHDDPSKKWFVVAGVAQPGLMSTLKEGMHDIRPEGLSFSKVQPQTDPYKPPGSFFSEALWGFNEGIGLSTTRVL